MISLPEITEFKLSTNCLMTPQNIFPKVLGIIKTGFSGKLERFYDPARGRKIKKETNIRV